MRAIVLTLCIVLCGCGIRRVTQEEISDTTGSNRLARVDQDVSSLMDRLHGERGFNFDSLVWRTNAGGVWRDHIVISEAAFQAGSSRRRWVSQINSLDASNGRAIIKVAEESAPQTSGGRVSFRVIYSWREWNLLTNGEVRMIRICANPFEKY